MKHFFTLLLTVCATQVSLAQYNLASLNGPWFIQSIPADPYNDNLMYIVFDGAGGVVAFSGFCDAVSGTYTVSPTGTLGGSLVCDDESFPIVGQLTSATTGTVEVEGTFGLVKVSDPGALATTLSGTLSTNCGTNTVTLTIDENGLVTAATGLVSPVAGRVYTEGGMLMGHLTTGASDAWGQFSISGYYAEDEFTGMVALDANDCNISEALLTHSISISVDETALSAMVIYPNPASDVVDILVGDHREVLTLGIYNAMGALVGTQAVAQQRQSIDTRGLSNGIYTVIVQSATARASHKLVIQR
jgi:hypothetical protein